MKVVLAYSGGLDTSVAIHWLKETRGVDVIAFYAQIGQIEDTDEITRRATAIGAVDVVCEDLRGRFVDDFILPALRAGARYEGSYLLAAPLGRPLIASRAVEIAHEMGAEAVAHGATGKGNDQVRFYTSIVALDPSLTIIAPLIEWEMKTRDDEIAYARAHGIPIDITEEKPYSIDTNLWGSSIECGDLDDLSKAPNEEIYQMTVAPLDAPDTPQEVTVGFERGVPVALDGEALDPVELIERLNRIGGGHGVGRIDILENRVVGFKTRGVYESPAGTLLHAAYHELENLVTDRETLHQKRLLSQRYSNLVYDGQWFSPLRRAIDGFVEAVRERVTGTIRLSLYKGSVSVAARESENSLYQHAMSTYSVGDAFDHSASRGFAYVTSLPLRMRKLAGGSA